LIRNADLVVLVCDLAAFTMLADCHFILSALEEKRIVLKSEVSTQPDDPRYSYKRTIICAHKEYEDESGEKQSVLRTKFPGFRTVATSILDDDSLVAFKKAVFDSLHVIRVFTKPVGHDPDFSDPIILPIGSTVDQAAATLHKDFAQKLKFARVWGEGKFDGQRVHHDFVLSDGDILEFHI
jgi:ribosome-interacting GTPase 1